MLLLEFLQVLHSLGLEELVDAAEVLTHAAMAKLVDLADQPVEEVTVVAHHDKGAVEILKRLLEDILGLEVQMIGGLVEDKQVDRLKQQLEDGEARTLSTRQHLDLLGRLVAAKHEGAEQVAYLAAYVALGHIVDGLEHGEVVVEQRRLVLGEIAYLDIVAQIEVSLVLQFAHDALHEGRLTLAVGPTKAILSPRSTVRLTPLKTVLSPNDIDTSLICTG